MGDSSPEPLPTTPGSEANAAGMEAATSALEARAVSLLEQGQRGAHWFYWVAGLSLVNSAIMLSGGGIFFVIGLGVTLVIDVIAHQVATQDPDLATVAMAIAIVLDVGVAVTAAGFGWLATKRYLIVFGIGMFLYTLDGVLFALLGDWMSVAFHVFALVNMWSGLQAYRQLKEVEAAYHGLKTLESLIAHPLNGAPLNDAPPGSVQA